MCVCVRACVCVCVCVCACSCSQKDREYALLVITTNPSTESQSAMIKLTPNLKIYLKDSAESNSCCTKKEH